MTPPRTTVVVPVYNRAASIGPCIASLLASDHDGPFEVVVVDNASTDATPRILDSFGDRLVRVRDERRGPAAARNAGIAVARGAVVAFTDSDCTVSRHWLRTISAPLEDPAVGAAGGRILAMPGAGRIARFGERIHDHRRAIEGFARPYFITMNLAARLDVLRAVGCFDERLIRCEDVDLAWRIGGAGYRIVYVHDAVVHHENRSSLAGLVAEGWLHGYHAAALDRLHGNAADGPLEPAPRSAGSRPLPAAEEALYSVLFRAAKKVGRACAAIRPPAAAG